MKNLKQWREANGVGEELGEMPSQMGSTLKRVGTGKLARLNPLFDKLETLDLEKKPNQAAAFAAFFLHHIGINSKNLPVFRMRIQRALDKMEAMPTEEEKEKMLEGEEEISGQESMPEMPGKAPPNWRG